MKSLKERLEKKIEKDATNRSMRQCSTGHIDLDKAISWYLKVGFESGAASLVPLVVELANELQLIAIQKTKDEYESDEDNDIWDFVCASEAYEITILKSRKAFQSIEKLMGEK